MSSGRKIDYKLKNLPAMISEQSGISAEQVQAAVDSIMKRAVNRARKEQRENDPDPTASVELLVLQYSFRALDNLLDALEESDHAQEVLVGGARHFHGETLGFGLCGVVHDGQGEGFGHPSFLSVRPSGQTIHTTLPRLRA